MGDIQIAPGSFGIIKPPFGNGTHWYMGETHSITTQPFNVTLFEV